MNVLGLSFPVLFMPNRICSALEGSPQVYFIYEALPGHSRVHCPSPRCSVLIKYKPLGRKYGCTSFFYLLQQPGLWAEVEQVVYKHSSNKSTNQCFLINCSFHIISSPSPLPFMARRSVYVECAMNFFFWGGGEGGRGI